MLTHKFYQVALAVGLSFVVASSTLGCSGGQKGVKSADHIEPGTMPEGGEWEGVYYNQMLGFLHITVSSGAAQGAWKTTAGDKWGELYGEINGDVLKYTWTERTIGVVGPASKSEGKGYFKYKLGKKPGEAHELVGEWGLGEDAVGHSWDCVKQTNMEADPKSVRPDEMESRVGASGFDGAKGDADIADVNSDAPADGEDKKPAEPKKDGAPDPL